MIDNFKTVLIYIGMFGLSDVFVEKTKINKLIYYSLILIIAYFII